MIHSPIGQDGSEVRVILVGATGLDAALRRDPAIELIRSRTPLDAIGELADPIDDTSPTRSVVIVSPEAARVDAGEVRQFIEGLRLIDPHVRVLRLRNDKAVSGSAGAGMMRGAEHALFDAEVSSQDATEDLLAVIRGQRRPGRAAILSTGATDSADAVPSPWVINPMGRGEAVYGRTNGAAHEPSNAAAPALAETPSDAPASTPGTARGPAPESQVERKPARGGVGDQDLAAEVGRGRDPGPLAIEVLRSRLGGQHIEFIEAGAEAAEVARADTGSVRVPVRWGDASYGMLEAAGVAAADLQRHAEWLATWLRLGEQHRELREAAYRDPLTGAWNRRYFDRFMAAALEKSRDGRHNLTLLVFDIDDFKMYNDRYGHPAGDEILIETVRLLQATVRPTDRVCRIGGDEFAVVFYEPTGPREAGSRHPTSFFDIAKRFQKQVWEHRFPKLGAQAPGTLTISGGLATFPWDGTTPEGLLERADRLAMDSKRLGKNAITLGPGAMRACNGEGC